MILLDTHVVSEMMKREPAQRVVSWMANERASNLYVSSITQAEILHGVMLLPQGRRRKPLETAAATMFAEDFADRLLVFGSEATVACALICIERERREHPIAAFDAQIAAIARASGATLATRNTADFEYCDVRIVNPWT